MYLFVAVFHGALLLYLCLVVSVLLSYAVPNCMELVSEEFFTEYIIKKQCEENMAYKAHYQVPTKTSL